MKILHVIHSIDPKNGGTTSAISQIASIMTSRGHSVEVAVLGDRESDPWVKDFPVPAICFGPSFLKYSFNLKFRKWLRQHAAGYDLVIVNGLWQFVGVATASIMRTLGRPYIVFVHGMLGPYGKQQRFKFLKKFVYWTLIEKRVVERASAVIFTSEEEERLSERFFNERSWTSLVLGNSVDKPPLPDAADVSAFLRRFAELREKKILLCVGRIHPIKGCDILVRAFASAFATIDQYHLVMAGPAADNEYLSQLQQMTDSVGIRRQVTWTGYLTPRERNVALSLASLFVSPSHHENFGMAIVEGLASGVPVILTDKVNIHSILERERAAIICNDTEAGLLDALRQWQRCSPDDLTNLCRNQLRCWETHFSRESVSSQLETQLMLLATKNKTQ